MDHFLRLRSAMLLLSFTLPVVAQDTPAAAAAVHQRVPPPENATAQELEQQGDILRTQKDYLGSIDYYRAAWKKADSAVLHNKAGIGYLQLRRDRDAKREYERSI